MPQQAKIVLGTTTETTLVIVPQVESFVGHPHRDLGPRNFKINPVESSSNHIVITKQHPKSTENMANRGGGVNGNNIGNRGEGEGTRQSLFGGNNDGRRGGTKEQEEEETTFGFPILDITKGLTLKNISLAPLPLFRDMST